MHVNVTDLVKNSAMHITVIFDIVTIYKLAAIYKLEACKIICSIE